MIWIECYIRRRMLSGSLAAALPSFGYSEWNSTTASPAHQVGGTHVIGPWQAMLIRRERELEYILQGIHSIIGLLARRCSHSRIHLSIIAASVLINLSLHRPDPRSTRQPQAPYSSTIVIVQIRFQLEYGLEPCGSPIP